MSGQYVCPSCSEAGMSVFYEVENAPVHSVLLLSTRDEAVGYPSGDISLALCTVCGFICNVAFDTTLHEYSAKYEATQSCSPTFNVFHRNLAAHLIDRFDLYDKDIIEIGCGQGEFLTLLCELGGNRGVGFDPAYDGRRLDSEAKNRLTFVSDFYSEENAHYHGDFVVCKMTLEHILDTSGFVSTVRRSVGDRFETVVFFQVPDVMRILREQAFWDIYYEHCSYFSPGSLARLFRRCGFDVIDLWKDYDDQYLMVEAVPNRGQRSQPLPQEEDPVEVAQDVAYFVEHCQRKFHAWRHELQGIAQDGRRVVLWGGGSKAVAFLTTLTLAGEVEYVVDINPLKHGTFLAGTGQEVVSPDFLREYRPDVVVVMNSIYCDEIQADLNGMGLNPELVPV